MSNANKVARKNPLSLGEWYTISLKQWAACPDAVLMTVMHAGKRPRLHWMAGPGSTLCDHDYPVEWFKPTEATDPGPLPGGCSTCKAIHDRWDQTDHEESADRPPA